MQIYSITIYYLACCYNKVLKQYIFIAVKCR